MEQGDILYKQQNSLEFLSAAELSKSITIQHLTINVDFTADFFGFLHGGSNSQSEFIHNIHGCNDFTGILIFISGYTFAVIPNKRHYYLVDSHSQDQTGMPSGTGSAIILKFADVVQLTCYIFEAYFTSSSSPIQYELQFITVEDEVCSASDRSKIVAKHRSEGQISRKLVSNAKIKCSTPAT